MKSYFDPQQLGFLIGGITCCALSLVFYLRSNFRVAVWILIIGGATLFSFAALLDPFLNVWDERFHALVAKNMMEHPFHPMLYTEKWVSLDYSFWASAHIWLHKQPLFLWQTALSFKMFGVSEFTLRLPGIILSTLLIPALYRSGKLLVSPSVGYLTAFLWVTSFYLFELISGRQMLDQNDVSFVCYISFSIWAWLEYLHSGKRYWLVLIAIFSGAAILCKWFVGLTIYLIWGSHLLLGKERSWKNWLPLCFSFLITLAMVLPWQIYTFSFFPDEALQEWKYNSLHFSVSVEGHEGDGWYHFTQIGNLFGQLTPFLIIPGWIIAYRNSERRKLFLALLVGVLGVELFFVLAATKMPSFTFILVLPMFVVLAAVISYMIEWFRNRQKRPVIASSLVFVLLFSVMIVRIDAEKLQEIHTEWNPGNIYTPMLKYNRSIFVKLDKTLPDNAVLFNVKGRHYVEAMFYTGNSAYRELPTQDDLKNLFNQNMEVWVFQRDDQILPDYILSDSRIHLIQDQLQGYE